MRDSETFGVEKGSGDRVVDWLNQQSPDKLKARLYGHVITTKNFGDFEMFSWMGDVHAARKLTVRASKKFKVKIIEGGYKPKERVFRMSRFDYAMVRRGAQILGHLEFEAPLFGGFWNLKLEERK